MISKLTQRINNPTGNGTVALAIFLANSICAPPALAQDSVAERVWSNSTELGWVFTYGNATTNSFNLRNVFEYEWLDADLNLEFGILRAASGDERFALGTEEAFEIIEPPVEPDTERMYATARYLRNVSDRFFWYGRFDVERDQPADITFRLTPAGGAGNNWETLENIELRTGYGFGYSAGSMTFDGSSNYFGYQLFYEFDMKVNDNTDIDSSMTLDGSIMSPSNYRFHWANGIGVAINERIALKASLRLVYRNDPAQEEIDLEDLSGAVLGNVIVSKKKLDSGFTTSLVINF
jgi:putative salt-induced outer membrane protein YdiY